MAETRWLDDKEQVAWRTFMVAVTVLFEQLKQELNASTGLSLTDYEILVRLSEADSRCLRMSELANSALSSRSRMSHAVTRLEQAGWVRREGCATDKRGAFATLTDDGMAKLESAAPFHVESVRRHLLDQLSPKQLSELESIARGLVRHLGVESSCGVFISSSCGAPNPSV